MRHIHQPVYIRPTAGHRLHQDQCGLGTLHVEFLGLRYCYTLAIKLTSAVTKGLVKGSKRCLKKLKYKNRNAYSHSIYVRPIRDFKEEKVYFGKSLQYLDNNPRE